jgi:hypothetical protein
MEKISDLLPFLVPILLLELILLVVALTDLVRRDRVRGPKWVWVLVIVCFSILGPVVYLLLGRVEDPLLGVGDPLLGNEDPLLGNEDPLLGNEDPLLGSDDSRWGEE